jgi:CO/xanthine dehydrogenase Mo-binding subunit
LSFSEAPQVRTVLIDRPLDPPLGCAEAVVGPASAAVGNGVQRLLGVPVRRLPLTRHEIVAAISEA